MFLLSLIACSTATVWENAEAPEDETVTGPDQEELAFTDALDSFAKVQHSNKELSLLAVGTNSMNGGIDSWRTCGKLTATDFGFPKDTPTRLLDDRMKICGKNHNPESVVAVAMFIGPTGLEKSFKQPVHDDETMHALITAITDVD